MKRASPYLKMRVLGAIEFTPGNTIVERRHVSSITFTDDDDDEQRFSSLGAPSRPGIPATTRTASPRCILACAGTKARHATSSPSC
jgi:hypothetical protein